MSKIRRFIKTVKNCFLKRPMSIRSTPSEPPPEPTADSSGSSAPKTNKQQKKNLAVAGNGQKLFLFYGLKTAKNKFLKLSSSSNGLVFNEKVLKAKLNNKASMTDNILNWREVRITADKNNYFLTYTKGNTSKERLYVLSSKDLMNWKREGSTNKIKGATAIVPDFQYDNEYFAYFGEKNIKSASSKDLKKWTPQKNILLKPRPKTFDSKLVSPANAFQYSEGLVLFYYGRGKKNKLSIGVAMFDKDNPEKLIWRCESPLWQQDDHDNSTIHPLGIIRLSEDFLFYGEDENGKIFSAFLPQVCYEKEEEGEEGDSGVHPILERIEDNPVLEPMSENDWESVAAFNPTSFECDEGKIYIIYRAIGDDDVSLFGCAISDDGVNIREKINEPIYLPREKFEGAEKKEGSKSRVFQRYMSAGGGQGGCEDPKITRMDDTVHLTYVAYDGENPPRVALSSIKLKDFKNRQWDKWSKPVLISPPGVIDKSALLLPEKINGKYVIFHRIYPNVLVDFVDDLNSFDGETFFLQGEYKIPPAPMAWDSKKISIASAPIRTEYGWLAIYHGVGYQEPLRYKVGAMLLDLDDPTKVLHRSRRPIMEPETDYENNGYKFGILYPGGANVKNNTLFVYYGGSDKYTCVAKAPFDRFLNQLITSEEPKVRQVK
jgi:predicted GH43/DUF377 family glycosyl hydrolase